MSEAPPHSVREVEIESVQAGGRTRRRDALAVEEPLEIRVRAGPSNARQEASLGLTMRTPGLDEELAAGLLLSEGVVLARRDLVGFSHGVDRDGLPDANVVVADLAFHVVYDPRTNERVQLRSSACGVCGRASLDALRARKPPPARPDAPRFTDAALRSLPHRLRGAQRVFDATGGLHAAALVRPDGAIEALREDVGRHNAVDKLVGSMFLLGRTPLEDYALLVSGRASFEILQKALFAGLPIVAAIGAPSSLAVELAQDFGLTLVGFLKPESFNVYAGAARLA